MARGVLGDARERRELCPEIDRMRLQAGRTAIETFLEDEQVRVFLLAHKAGAQGECPANGTPHSQMNCSDSWGMCAP